MARTTAKNAGWSTWYSDLAIETALTLGCVFGLRLRQTEGFMGSVFDLMGLDIPVPDHTTLSRRAQKWKPPARRNPPLPDGPLLDQIDGGIDQLTADGAYDDKPAYRAVLQHSSTASVVIPPRSTAVESGSAGPPGQRDKHIATIAKDGRLQWQAATGYGKRALIETAIGRYKGLIGRRLRARSFAAQQTEVTIGCAVLNRMLACGRPDTVRCKARQA